MLVIQPVLLCSVTWRFALCATHSGDHLLITIMVYIIYEQIFNTMFTCSKHIQNNINHFHIHEYSLHMSPAYLPYFFLNLHLGYTFHEHIFDMVN